MQIRSIFLCIFKYPDYNRINYTIYNIICNFIYIFYIIEDTKYRTIKYRNSSRKTNSKYYSVSFYWSNLLDVIYDPRILVI